MKLSARTEYACLALIELAKADRVGRRLRVRDIAARHNIPSAFLVQILLQLKVAGLVESTRGAHGGYHLARRSSDVSLWDVWVAVEASNASDERGVPVDAGTALGVVRQAWDAIFAQQRAVMQEVTLADLVERATRYADEPMYHI